MTDKMKVQYIAPQDLNVPDVRITSVFDDEIYAMFEDDIKKTGISQPLLVAKDKEKLWIVDGKNRRDQALLQGLDKIPCVVIPMTLKDLQLRNLVLNRLRGRTKASEEVHVIKDLNENHGCGIEEIVERTGMKRERVEQLLQIGGTDPEVWETLDREEIKVCHAFQLSRLVDRSAQLRMLRIVLQYRMNCTTLKEAVDEAIKIVAKRLSEGANNPTPVAPPIPTATCAVCKGDYPLRDLSSPVLCRSCFAILISSYDTAHLQVEKEKSDVEKITEDVTGGGEETEGDP